MTTATASRQQALDGVERNALRQIDAALNAAHGVEAVRALVLDLAVRGRLLGDAKLASFSPGSEPFPVPSSWRWARVEDLTVKLGAGSTPLGGKKVYKTAGIKFLRSQNVWNDGLRLDDVAFIDEKTHDEMRGTWVEAGDILLNITGASIGRSAVVPDGFDSANVSQHVAIVRLADKGSRRFVHLCIISPYFQRRVMDVQVGVSREGLSMKRLRDFVVPLPPVDEQKRIVAKVDQLMALCDELEAKQAKKRDVGDRLTKAALAALTSAETPEEFNAAWHRVAENFNNLFDSAAVIADLREALLDLAMKGLLVRQETADGTAHRIVDALPSKKSALAKSLAVRQGEVQEAGVPEDEQPHPIPSSWRWVRLSAFGCFMGGGTPSKANPEFWKGSIPWVSPKDMKRPSIADAEDHISRAALESSAAKLIPSPSLLMVLRGMILAHSFPVAITERDVAVNQDMRALVFADPSLAPYVLRACQAARARVLARVERSSHGTCRLDSEIAESLPIPLPPLAEQKRIIQRLDELTTLCDQLEGGLRAREAVAASLAESLAAGESRDR